MVKAYAFAGYTMREIATYFGVHYLTVRQYKEINARCKTCPFVLYAPEIITKQFSQITVKMGVLFVV
jgi:predicted nucleotide-binding protein (sugar kinase/HSP70/actin superfamily)